MTVTHLRQSIIVKVLPLRGNAHYRKRSKSCTPHLGLLITNGLKACKAGIWLTPLRGTAALRKNKANSTSRECSIELERPKQPSDVVGKYDSYIALWGAFTLYQPDQTCVDSGAGIYVHAGRRISRQRLERLPFSPEACQTMLVLAPRVCVFSPPIRKHRNHKPISLVSFCVERLRVCLIFLSTPVKQLNTGNCTVP